MWRRALRHCLVVLASAGAMAASVAHAADEAASNGPVTVKLTQSRVEVEAGKEKLVEAETVKPGDVIEYRAVYTNVSKAAVRDLTATLPVPEGLVYVPRSAKGSEGLPAAQAVARDGQSGAEPLMVTEGGKKVVVPYTQYRVLRWRVGAMPAGRSVTVSARARVAASPLETSAMPANAGAAPQR